MRTEPEPLGRILGPDALELLDAFVRDRVEASLREREAERRWLTIPEAAAYLGLSEKAIRRRIERGTIAYSRLGSGIRVDRRALDSQLERQRRNGPDG